jgi:hypothetical protein
VPAVVAVGTAVVPASEGLDIWHSIDGWDWTLSGCNNCPLRSHNSWHSSNGWYWTLTGWNDCRPHSHNSWHSSDGWYWILSG